MDSPGSPTIDEDDVPIPCKGCNQVLEEGKAFELAGNRWHIDCFRCNSCGTLLDSDANLLLLGDGSLICNSCTYSCTACGNKIEDLAILTGEQAFCAGCFRCRNCKRKIENLKYARTSQGIFCMNCHETLMARRRKRPKPQPSKTPVIGSNSASPMLSLDKSLPSLPVEEDRRPSSGHSATPTELSSPARPPNVRTNTSPDQLSPVAFPGIESHLKTTPRLHKRHSQTSQLSETSVDAPANNGSNDPYSSFIPVVLDNSPAAPLPSTAYQRPGNDLSPRDQSKTRPSYERNTSDTSSYFDSERERGARPHIASQDKSYQPRTENGSGDRPRKSHDSDRDRGDKPAANSEQRNKVNVADGDSVDGSGKSGKREDFRLGEVPRERKRSLGSTKAFDGDDSQLEISISFSPTGSSHNESSAARFNPANLPRGDSFRSPPSHPVSPSGSKRQTESPINSTSSSGRSYVPSASTALTSELADSTDKGLKLSTKTTVTNISHNDGPNLEASPLPKSGPMRRPSTHDSSFSLSESEASPALPTFSSPIGNLSFDEELRRVFGGGGGSGGDSILRRVSTSKHGRSISDIARGSGQSPKWPTSPGKSGYKSTLSPELSSPNTAPQEENTLLKQELRRSAQKIADLEARLNHTASAKALEANIEDKRNTVALLETEREAFLRELMVIKERLDASRDGQAINMDALKSDLIRGLTRELEDLKETLKEDIAALVVQRDQLVEDVENFGRLREQAIQETEQLNLKNAQLADLNNELTRRIQGQFKANKHQVGGLGIYDGNGTEFLDIKEHGRGPPTTATSASISTSGTPIQEQPDGAEVFVAQKVAPFKTGGQPKKFFWKKPGTSIMKGAGKGFNRVFGPESQRDGMPLDVEDHRIFGNRKVKAAKIMNGSAAGGNVETHVPIFGGELEARADYEQSHIPNVVQKCIQEVEIRGMDFEGIYRKSGGATQMRQIQDQFERGEDVQFDASLDICSVTSVLKQYFRNLPNPLITYEVYDRFVDIPTIHDEEVRLRTIKEVINDLPSIHRDVLQFVIFHLARVAARKEENLMNTRNLAVVFAPTLLRHTSDEREMTDMHAKNSAIQYLIDNNDKIF